jgi:trans-2,3-dihydro-3-hydroxyanthranilate isomerase
VEVEVLRRDGAIVGASIQAPQKLEIAEEIASATIASCASIEASEVVSSTHRPVFASVGLPFAIAELRSLEALGKATPNAAAFRDACQLHPGPIDRFSLFLYVRTGAGKVRARMFAPLSKVLEDPATGSASAALGGLLSSLEAGTARFELAIEQGVEMGRPSLIDVRVDRAHGVRHRIYVAGDCVPVMKGAIALPEGARWSAS